MARIKAGWRLLLSWLAMGSGMPVDAYGQPLFFENARLRTGEDRPAMENSVFVIENGRFVDVGQAEFQASP